MFRSALVATDLSSASDAVVDYFEHLKPLGIRKIHLLHVLRMTAVRVPLDVVQAYQREPLERATQRLAALGFEVVSEMPVGIPWMEIQAAAERHDVDLVVVGSLGESLLAEALLGSTAHQVLMNVRRPILVLRLEVEDGVARLCNAAAGPLLDTILFPTDFSENAELARPLLRQLLVAGPVRHLALLHVQERARIFPHLADRLDEFNRIDRERLGELAADLAPGPAVEVTTEIELGAASPAILQAAERHRASLIVLGTSGRNYIAEMLLGSVANEVARRASCPVLLLPMPQDSPPTSCG